MKKIKIIVPLLIAILLLTQVIAFTTNGTDKTFDFAITSGNNNNLNSTNFKSFLVVGSIAGNANSSNFKTEIGFLSIAPYSNGEPCKANVECTGNFCCSSVCQSSSCPTTTAATTSTGGGGGGTGAAAAAGGGGISITVQDSKAQVWITILAGSTIIMDINRSGLAVTAIIIENIKKTLTNVEIEVRALIENPVSVEPVPLIYQYIKINNQNIVGSDADNIKIRFKIPQIWLTENNLASRDISLYRYNGAWDELTTRVIEDNLEYVTYESLTPDFSSFAIGINSGILVVSPKSIREKLNRGKVSEKTLTIRNGINSKINISLSILGIKEYLSLSKQNFVIEAEETEEVTLNFKAIKVGSFTGQIIIKTDSIERSIPIIFDVIPEEVLFDAILNIDPASKKLAAGQKLKIKVFLNNLRDKQYTVDIRYLIKDLNNDIVFEEQQTLTLKKDISFDRSLTVPSNLKNGFYVAVIEVIHDQTIGAISSDIFEIIEQVKVKDVASYVVFKTLFYIGLVILIFTVLGILRFIIIKRKKITTLNQNFWNLTAVINSKIKAKKQRDAVEIYNQLIKTYNELIEHPLEPKTINRMKRYIKKTHKILFKKKEKGKN